MTSKPAKPSKLAKPNRFFEREGLSLVELLMAMTLLALISMAGLKIMQLSESSFSEGRTQLTIQQKNQAITAFINDDFKNQLLAEQTTVATYEKMAMPASEVAHLIWPSANRTISKFRLAWFKRKK